MNSIAGNRIVLPCMVELENGDRAAYPTALIGDELFEHIVRQVHALSSLVRHEQGEASWRIYALSSGGFFMAPKCDALVNLIGHDGMHLRLNAEAFGIACCLLTLKLALDQRPTTASVNAEQVKHLELFATGHRDWLSIVSAQQVLRGLLDRGTAASSSCPAVIHDLRTAYMDA